MLEKKALELRVTRQFLSSLRRGYTDPVDPGSEAFADALTHSPDGRPMYIQVTRFIDPIEQELRNRRRMCLDGLFKANPTFKSLFQGMNVNFTDDGDSALLPKPRAKDGSGKRFLDDLASNVLSSGTDIARLEPGAVFDMTWRVGADGVRITLRCSRTPDGSEVVRWGGGTMFPPGAWSAAQREAVIKNVLTPKSKKYAKPDATFLLLAYSFDLVLMPSDPIVGEAVRYLTETAHPFDEVWYFFPPLRDSGAGTMMRLWPWDGAIPADTPDETKKMIVRLEPMWP